MFSHKEIYSVQDSSWNFLLTVEVGNIRQYATLSLVFHKDMHSLRISMNQPVGRKHWPNPQEHTHSLIFLFKLLMSLLLLLSNDTAIMLIVLLLLISKREWSKTGKKSTVLYSLTSFMCKRLQSYIHWLGKSHWTQTYPQESVHVTGIL